MNSELDRLRQRVKCLCVLDKTPKPDYTCPKDGVTAIVGQEISFNANVLDTFDVKGFLPVHYDLLVLCAAIEFADRRWKRPQRWSRNLHLKVPVSVLGIWQDRQVLASLYSVLRHLTGDNWKLTFVQAREDSSIGVRQRELYFPDTKTFAIPYSDGLDSRAVAALSGDKNEALCIRVAKYPQRRSAGDGYFTQIPFKVNGFRSNESSFRSRGFQFAAVTAVAAHICNLSRIVAPDSGQSALGPVLLPLHNIYPDYRNHPTFFRKMERFIKVLLGHHVQYEQSRLWLTKGQTLQAFLNLPGKHEKELTSTRSCWQNRRIVNSGGSKKHCGLCVACLLRRQSMHTTNVTETSDTYVVSDLSTPQVAEALSVIPNTADRNLMAEYGSVGTRYLQRLADMATVPDCKLRVHVSEIAAATGATFQETMKNLRALLATHAEEWRTFLPAQGEQSFLKNWMDGGRYG